MKYSSAKKKTEYQGRNSSNKKQAKYMNNLTQELQQSRIAVQHIANFRKDEQLSSKHIQVVKNQLHQCVIQINTEQKKQIVLKQLVSLLKGEMTKIQAKDMEIQQKQQEQLQKNLKQLRQDIDKISQKKNQQVAKIAVLKQSANQSRSQRVVYSNLFKKLQTQLKENQQIYKNQLLKAQKTKFQLQMSPTKKKGNCKDDDTKHMSVSNGSYISRADEDSGAVNTLSRVCNGQQKLYVKYQKGVHATKQQQQLNSICGNNIRTCQRLNQETHNSGTGKGHEQYPISRGKSAKTTKIFRYNSSKQNIQNCASVMEQLTKFIDRVKISVGCQNVQQITHLSTTICSDNQELLIQISDLNEQIQKYENQIALINKHSIYRQQNQSSNQYIQFQQQFQTNSFVNSLRNSAGSERDGNFLMTKIKHNQGKQNIAPDFLKNKQKHSRNGSSHPLSFWNDDIHNYSSQFMQLCNFFRIDLPLHQEESQFEFKQESITSRLSNLQIKQTFKKLDNVIQEIWNQINPDKTGNSIFNQIDYFQNEAHDANTHQKQITNDLSRLKRLRRESHGQLNLILSRMDRFGNCQKILDRQGFCVQYRKQINRKTKMKNKRI